MQMNFSSRMDSALPKEWPELARVAQYEPARFAKLVKESPWTIRRRLKRMCGVAMLEWLTGLRIAEAMQRLRRGGMTRVIAKDLRFCNESHFCRAFKRRTGKTPQDYARSFC